MQFSYEQSLYHKLLRISVCVVAAVLVFESGLLVPTTSKLSLTAREYVATAVGVGASVAPNEMNQLTSRIQELESDLEAKDRLIAVQLSNNQAQGINRSTFILSGILFILLVLIVLNYALDYVRARERVAENRDEKKFA